MYFARKRLIGKFIGVATAAFLVLAMMPGLAWGIETSEGSLPQEATTASVTLENPPTVENPQTSIADPSSDPMTLVEPTQSETSTDEPSQSAESVVEKTIDQTATPETDSFTQLALEQVQVNNQTVDPIKKEVSVDGATYYDGEVNDPQIPDKIAEIGPGGTVYYKLTFVGQSGELTDVEIIDTLDDGFKYLPGSAKLKTSTSETPLLDPGSAGLVSSPQKLEWKGSNNIDVPAPSGEPAQNAAIIYAVMASTTASSGEPIEPYVNTAEAGQPLPLTSGTEPSLGSDTANVIVTEKDLVIDKKVSADGTEGSYKDAVTVGPGDKVYFKVVVTNNNTETSYDESTLRIDDYLPSGFTLLDAGDDAPKINDVVAASDQPGVPSWTLTKSVGTKDAPSSDTSYGDEVILTFRATASNVPSTVAYINVSQLVKRGDFPVYFASDTAEVSVGASLTKQVSVASAAFADEAKVKQGEKVSYKIVVTNPGVAELANVIVKDTLPNDFTYVPDSSKLVFSKDSSKNKSGVDANPGKTEITDSSGKKHWVLTWPATGAVSLATGENLTLTCDVTASKVVSETAYENKAEAFQGEAAEPFDSDSTKVTVILKEVKELVGNSATDITHDSVTASPSATVHYKITVKNDDTADVTGLTIEDTLPTGFSYQTGSTSGATTENPLINGQKLTWSNITAKAGQETSLTFKATASSTVSTTAYVNTAEVKKGAVSQGSDTASVTVTGTTSLSITKSVDKSSASPNDTPTYTISYSNTGNVQLTNVVTTDGIPTGSSYVAGSATGGGVFDQAANALTWAVGSLAAGGSGSVSFKVVVSASATGTITNTATIDTDQTDPKTASASTTVVVVLATTQQPATLPGETGSQLATAQQLPTTLPKTGLDLLGYLFGAAMLVSSGLFLRRLGRDKR